MIKLNPYLTFPGNCEEAFEFYRSVFGGEFLYKTRFSDIPSNDEVTFPEYKMNRIMHIALSVGKDNIIMGGDSDEEWGSEKVQAGNNMSLSITTRNKEDADRFFEGLCGQGKMTMQIGDVFWGSYFGMCTDKYGINWMVKYDNHEEQV